MHPNNLGSTTFVTDETGATIQKTIHYPWGQAWATAGSLKDNRFASMEQVARTSAFEVRGFWGLMPEYSLTLDHRQSCGRRTRPALTGLR